MTQQIINLGTADKGNGDVLRTAFGKVNANFAELYTLTGDDIQIPAQATHTGKVLTTNGTTLSWGTVSYTSLTDKPTIPTSFSSLVNGTKTVSLDTDGYITLAHGAKLYDYGSGTGNGYGITDAANGTYIGYDPTDTLGALHLDSYNGKNIRIRTTTLPSTYKDWLFGSNGGLTFPDATIQTTAYQKVAVPVHSYGVAGDKTGMLAFDATYIYYCTADYVNDTTDIWKRTAHGAGTW